MKNVLITALVLLIVMSCRKDRIAVTTDKLIRCGVSSMSKTNLLGSDGFRIIYDADGRPSQLITRLNSSFGYVDSIFYTFDYTGATIQVHSVDHPYILGVYVESDKELVPDTNTVVPDEDFEIKLDPSTGYATNVGNDEYRYENGRLTGFGESSLVYDSAGSVTEVSNQYEIVTYTYDAGQQKRGLVYPGTGTWFNKGYNLAETMQWIPPQAHAYRTGAVYAIKNPDEPETNYVFDTYLFVDPKLNSDGYLESFSVAGTKVTNEYKCGIQLK